MKTASFRFGEAFAILVSSVFVAYCLHICFVVVWYPGYETKVNQIWWEYATNTELTRIFKPIIKKIQSEIKE